MSVTTFLPIMTGWLYKPSKSYTVTGEAKLTDPVMVRLTPIRLETGFQQTSIRTDKSGSQSRAEESVFQGRVLIHPKYDVKPGDILEVSEIRYKVESIWPRYEMNGVLHHYQVDLSAWRERVSE